MVIPWDDVYRYFKLHPHTFWRFDQALFRLHMKWGLQLVRKHKTEFIRWTSTHLHCPVVSKLNTSGRCSHCAFMYALYAREAGGSERELTERPGLIICGLWPLPGSHGTDIGRSDRRVTDCPRLTKEGTAFLKPALNVFLAGMKMQCNEGDGRILLGDKIRGQAVMLRPIALQCAGVRVSTGVPSTYIHSWIHVYSIPTCINFLTASDIPERKYA
jgi:hypothetical protein